MNLYNKFKIWCYVRKLDKSYEHYEFIRFLIEKTNYYNVQVYTYKSLGVTFFISINNINNILIKTKEEVNYLLKLLYNKNKLLVTFSFCSPKEFKVNPNHVDWNNAEERFDYELSQLLEE